MKVADLKTGFKVKIISLLGGDKVYRHRLIAMGLLPGTEFTVSRVAPFGDPIEIKQCLLTALLLNMPHRADFSGRYLQSRSKHRTGQQPIRIIIW